MQSNANRLRIILKNTKILLPISAILIIAFNLEDISWLSSIVSGIWFVIIIIWWLFDKYLWKMECINKGLRLSKKIYCPIITGRWKGTLTRDGKDHDFVIEIKQTYTTISCSTYSLHSFSQSLCAELLYDQQNDIYSLVFLWQGKTLVNPDGETDPTNNFNGTTILRISDDCKEMTGNYFTDRSPKQTEGTIKLSKCQETLKNAF